MSTCARCTGTPEPASGVSASTLALCPEHALAVLEDVRRHLATTLSSLERATDRASHVLASGRSG
jgi:hypothetical protein